jgi:hypothetical protein
MNQFLANTFSEHSERLALGLEPLDAGRMTRIGFPFQVTFDAAPLGLPRPPIERHDSCLYVLRYAPGLANSAELRFFDATRFLYRPEHDRRRFVPRRLRIPLLPLASVDTQPFSHRVRHPLLFPGAAYDVSSTATGLRGRVERNHLPVRWTRIEAKLPGNSMVMGRAHGDDRGEFLLLLRAEASSIGELVNPLPIEVTIFAPQTAPVPNPSTLPLLDPLWDLPIEETPAPGTLDQVSTGEALPTGYMDKGTTTVPVIIGKLRSDIAIFTIT